MFMTKEIMEGLPDGIEVYKNLMIFTTGAFLMPVRLGNRWCWIVTGFEDSSFKNGHYVNVTEYAESKEDLINSTEE